MSNYIHFTDAQKQQARQTDIADLLRCQGETLKRSGSEYEWQDGSQKVTIRGNLWFHQYEQTGGDAIDFVRRYYNKSYPEAVEYLLGGCGGTLAVSSPVIKERKPFVLPRQNDNMRRIYAYLMSCRGIDREVLYTFVKKGMIYESADYHNVVFVGYDLNGVARHAHKRGSSSKSVYKGNVDGSLPEFSFHWHGTSGCVFLFEAPIDMLSFISLCKDGWEQHSYAASCGVSDLVLWQMMKDNPDLREVRLCRDNDEKGQEANRRTADVLLSKGISYEIELPSLKDWNEDLLHSQAKKELCPLAL